MSLKFKAIKQMADRGNVTAQFNLGVFYHLGDEKVAKDPAEAARYWKMAADQGLADAQFNVGLLYSRVKDNVKAARYWKMAADQGHSGAQYNLGALCICGSYLISTYCTIIRKKCSRFQRW